MGAAGPEAATADHKEHRQEQLPQGRETHTAGAQQDLWHHQTGTVLTNFLMIIWF